MSTIATRRRHHEQGMTLLEVMIVLAIIAGIVVLTTVGLSKLSKGDLVDDTVALTARLRQTSEMAIEQGVPHRLLIDLKQQGYVIERCEGRVGMVRAKSAEDLAKLNDPEKLAEALADAQQRVKDAGGEALSGGTSQGAAGVVAALAGQHVGDQQCAPVVIMPPGAAEGADGGEAQAAAAQAHVEAALTGQVAPGGPSGGGGALGGKLNGSSSIKFKEVLVQHLEEPVRDGQVAIYFFPDGSAEKAIIALTDGDAVFSVLVAGLTAQVDIRDHEIANPDDLMLRNPLGDEDEQR